MEDTEPARRRRYESQTSEMRGNPGNELVPTDVPEMDCNR